MNWGGLFLCLTVVLMAGCASQAEREQRMEDIVTYYKSQRSGYEACFKQDQNSKKDYFAKADVKWRVDLKGKAKEIAVKASGSGSTGLEDCLKRHLESLTFPQQHRFYPVFIEYQISYGNN